MAGWSPGTGSAGRGHRGGCAEPQASLWAADHSGQGCCIPSVPGQCGLASWARCVQLGLMVYSCLVTFYWGEWRGWGLLGKEKGQEAVSLGENVALGSGKRWATWIG